MRGEGLQLFMLERNAPFADALVESLGVPASPLEDRSFEDGEHKLRPLASVRDRDVFVVQSLYGQSAASVHDKLVELLFFIGALKDASAYRVTAVTPYLAYARKDRKSKPRDPVATRYVAQLFESVGTDCIVTLDVHNLAAFQNAFRCRTEHLEGNELFVRHFVTRVGALAVTVISPDAGGIKRAEAFRQRLAARIARPVGMGFAEKHRSSGAVSGDAFTGDVDGRIAIIVDDLISSGTTLARTAETCRKRGAARVYAAATHGVFAAAANTTLASAPIDEIVVLDTVPLLQVDSDALKAKLVQLSSAALFGEAIRRLHAGGSIVDLLKE